MDILSFVIEIVKVVIGPVCTIFYVKRRAKLSDAITITENQTSAEKVVEHIGDKVENLQKGINGRMGELLEVSNKANRAIGFKEGTEDREKREIYVYVIDDNSDDLVLIKKAFDKVGNISYKLYTNENLFKEKIPFDSHVYILDHSLEGTGETGVDILNIIKSKNTMNFAIAYTGSTNDNIRKQYEDAGVDRFIVKDDHIDVSLKLLVKYVLEGMELVALRR